MPLFHFTVRDGVTWLDPTGTELPNAAEARVQGIRFAGEAIRDHARKFADNED